MEDRVDAGQDGCITGRMQYRTDVGHEDAGQDGCMIGQIQDRSDTRQDG